MTHEAIREIARALAAQKVEYLVVGGVAAIAHGVPRNTFDIDLVIRLNPENVRRAFDALRGIGYLPRVPVTAEGFGDQEMREGWIRDKNMVVLNFHSDRFRETQLDVFVSEPFPFSETLARAVVDRFQDGTELRIVDIGTLIRMKEQAGRPHDLEDVERLREIKGRHEQG